MEKPNIKLIDPLKRKCFFDEEHPLDHPPQAYRKYSQARYLQNLYSILKNTIQSKKLDFLLKVNAKYQ